MKKHPDIVPHRANTKYKGQPHNVNKMHKTYINIYTKLPNTSYEIANENSGWNCIPFYWKKSAVTGEKTASVLFFERTPGE